MVFLMLAPFASFADEKIMVLGDSISSAYGMDPKLGWVSLLNDRLKTEGLAYEVVNASIAGDTVANGKLRAASAVDAHSPKIVIIELGGNDGLRGYPLTQIESNLKTLVEALKDKKIQVLLMGIEVPANLGPDYTQRFAAIYPKVSELEKVPLAPALGDMFWGTPGMIQPDGIHPSSTAQPLILKAVWEKLKPLL